MLPSFARIIKRFKSSLILSSHIRNVSHVAEFTQILGSNCVQTSDLDPYNTDWIGSHKGNSSLVLFPKCTEDLSGVLKFAYANDIKCVVQSGNTSLVEGSVPVENEVIISMRKMDRILHFDEHSGVLQCQGGCILQNLEEFVNEKNRIIPYDLGAKGSCLIGGNLATNAGGLRFIKYGPLHGHVLGIEVVLPNGEIVDLMSSMKKDNTGYHLRHLFIGSEGTLGVISKVSIACPVMLKDKLVSLIAFENFEKLLKFYGIVQRQLGEYLSCFEMLDHHSLEAVVNNLHYSPPFAQYYPFYVMFELSSNDGPYIEKRLFDLFEQLQSDSVLQDGIFAPDAEQAKFIKIRNYRELITEGLRKDGHCYKYDISLPIQQFDTAVEVVRQRLATANYTRVCGYGHIGDSNLHLNVTSKNFDPNILALIEPFLYQFVSEHKGSISAEHGIGYKKRQFLSYSKSSEAIDMMKRIKQLFDPKGILNPSKIF